MTPPVDALVLSGGGAAAAWQVGALVALREILGLGSRSPFPILCGTSAGAINAAVLACHSTSWDEGLALLTRTWREIHCGSVFRTDLRGLAAQWARGLTAGLGEAGAAPSLLDNAPLRETLQRLLPLEGLRTARASGALRSLAITCVGYDSGEWVSFFDADPSVEAWGRYRRSGRRVSLGVDHLMATTAVPFIFPPVAMGGEWYFDGSMGFLDPLSPAKHLGADRILVLSIDRPCARAAPLAARPAPTLSGIASHLLDTLFTDYVHSDLERLEQTNRIAAEGAARVIDAMILAPSEDLEALAGRHWRELPPTVRSLFQRAGLAHDRGSIALAYLLFEAPFTSALFDLGYRDALARAAELRDFFRR